MRTAVPSFSSLLLSRTAIAVPIALMLTFLIAVALMLLADAEDILRAYPSPELLENVHEIPVQVGLPVRDRPDETDFDGDGTPDELTIDYYQMEPLFRRITSAIAYVRSGGTQQILLARAIDCPFTDVHWCGDLDRNGTDDLFFADDGRKFVIGCDAR